MAFKGKSLILRPAQDNELGPPHKARYPRCLPFQEENTGKEMSPRIKHRKEGGTWAN